MTEKIDTSEKTDAEKLAAWRAAVAAKIDRRLAGDVGVKKNDIDPSLVWGPQGWEKR